MSAKLLVLGIDAANPDLLERWAAEGALPNIAALAARGLTGETRNVDGFHIGATWPSLCTGLTPARHGVHYTVQLHSGSYRFQPVIRKPMVAVTPFWTALSRAGKRVAVLDVPLSRMDPGIHGMQVVEWGGHDAVFGFRATPQSVEQEIDSLFGRHPHGDSCDADQRTQQDYVTFIDRLCQGSRLKGELTCHYLRQPWELFMQVFTEAHCAGHQCWHLHDEAHPAHDAAFARAHGDPLRRVYTAIDAAIGEILQLAGDARVLLFTAHGMAHWFGAQFLLDEILVRLGVAQPLSGGGAAAPANKLFTVAAHRVWRSLPASLRQALQPVKSSISAQRARTELPELGVDPARSACFAVPNGFAVAGIRLNLIGREPHGILQSGASAVRFCDELAAALLGIVDERTGNPLIKRVVRTADLYTGDYVDHLPDLLVEWRDEAATGSTAVGNGAASLVRVHSRRVGTLEGNNHYGRTGEHRPQGLFHAAGHGIAPGRLDRPISILDFAPTITRFLGVEMPDCEGQPVAELL
jgi:predicted AlkP superfamily phosphohydrolase/phosphomutase